MDRVPKSIPPAPPPPPPAPCAADPVCSSSTEHGSHLALGSPEWNFAATFLTQDVRSMALAKSRKAGSPRVDSFLSLRFYKWEKG